MRPTRRAFLAAVSLAPFIPQARATGPWVYMGDSITALWSIVAPELLHAGAINSGVSGETTQNMIDRFSTDVLAHSPAGMILMGGINDIDNVNGTAVGANAPAIMAHLATMADAVLAMGGRVVLCSIMPQGTARFPYTWMQQCGLDTNTLIRAYVAAHRHTVYCDYSSAVVDTNGDGYFQAGLTMDGIHPNHAGYAVMAPLTEAAITAVTAQSNGLFPLPSAVGL